MNVLEVIFEELDYSSRSTQVHVADLCEHTKNLGLNKAGHL